MNRESIILILYIISYFICISVQAQEMSAAEAMKQMNMIKLNKNYITATGTSSLNYEEAIENARALLDLEIENWMKENRHGDATGALAIAKDNLSTIQTMRGKMYRAFVYVGKKQIVPFYKEEKVVIVNTQNQIFSNSTDVVNKEVKSNDIEKLENRGMDLAPHIETVYVPTSFEQQMLQIERASDIEGFVKRSTIQKYGKYRERPLSGVYYLLLYNRDGMVPACLKFDNGKITNVKTGQSDSFENYKGCGAYWFK